MSLGEFGRRIRGNSGNFSRAQWNSVGLLTSFVRTGKRGHYERGLFTGGISRNSKIFKFSRISRKWSDHPLFFTVWGLSRIFYLEISRISGKWTYLKRRLFQGPLLLNPVLGHTPSTAGTFRKKFRKNYGKTPETLSECFLEFPSRVRLGSSQKARPGIQGIWGFQIISRILSPSVWRGTNLFSEVVPERASQGCCHEIRTSNEGISEVLRHEARNDYTNSSETILLCNRCVQSKKN